MTFLYSCRHSGDQYKITKFDMHFNVESSYLCDLSNCDCPAGHRPTCRHRDMLPKFLARAHIGDEWFLDFDRGGWVQGEIASAASSVPTDTPAAGDAYNAVSSELALPPQGVPTPAQATIRRRV